jgi:predicted phosphodiesterase
MKQIRKLVVAGDFHFGSSRALMPPSFKGSEGQTTLANVGQQWLWYQWKDFENWIIAKTEDEPYGLVLMGDLIEGIHHGGKGALPELEDHVSMACDVLGPMADAAAKTYVVLGTECHTHNCEHAIARAIGAEKADDGNGAFKDLDITINGTRCFFTHHAGVTSRVWTEGGSVSLPLANMQLERVRAKHAVIPTVFVAGHCHRYKLFEDGNALGVTTPSWQMLTRHGHKVVSQAVPHVGGVILDFDGEPGDIPQAIRFKRSVPQTDGVKL